MAYTSLPPGRRRFDWSLFLSIATLISSIWLPIAQAAKSASDYYIHDLPGAPSSPRLDMYAGHLEITPEHHGNLFFWLVKNRHIGDKKRLVLWLNGGPGCSSMDGALMEIGPYRVNPDGTLRLQDGSWDEFANVLFVDNPVGTGFSYVDTDSYVHDMDQMAEQMITFLDGFFELFPDHEHDDIYIAGESYAGQWIPYVAKAIVDRNKVNPAHKWNLSGLLIGNGWISGPDQYISYIPFAYEAGILQSGSEADRIATKQQQECLKALNQPGAPDKIDISVCESVMQEILRNTQTSGDQGCINMYDVRLRDSYPSCGMNWPPDLAQVKPYLRRDDVIKALHINSDKKTGWVECNNQVSAAFNARNSKPSMQLLPDLLEKMPIVLFSGDKDMICNHIGTENLINNLKFNGGVGMQSDGITSMKHDWTFEGEPAGQYQTARNLTYLRFYNSSHMVPFDYPRRSRDMLDRFMGVDIASIGGTPMDSKIDGEKGTEVSVGGHPNSTAAQEEEANRLQEAQWTAYRRSGEGALAVILIAAIAWGIFIWRGRRRRRGYRGLVGSDPYDDGRGDGLGLNNRKAERDVEAARAYDEAELDDMEVGRIGKSKERSDMDDDAFALDDEDDDDGFHHGRSNGRAS
ncbi:hypothetical protein DOTSEDRAFT_152310 [Dothistroma septosporum NZE10]|uniref:Carboxypeptidase n=1 Tax=Dothistroma septosporum (strain NZE10 / CBS 128990) TaxID=675120 RepID=N1PPU2_DOTSN|nr:hypothetical protein DOTSEDRAFT_152310 [Dothistroma septosporum NZE10]